MANRDDIGPRKIPDECLEFPDFCTTITKNPKSTREYFKLCYESFQPLEYYLEKYVGNRALLGYGIGEWEYYQKPLVKQIEIPEGYTCDMDYHEEECHVDVSKSIDFLLEHWKDSRWDVFSQAMDTLKNSLEDLYISPEALEGIRNWETKPETVKDILSLSKECTCSSFDLFHKGCTCGYMEAP